MKAGLADMVLGYVSAFLWSILTDRAYILLRIDDMGRCNQRTIEFGFKPIDIDWRASAAEVVLDKSAFGCLLPPYTGRHGDCKNDLTKFRKGDKQQSSIYPMFQVNNGFKDAFVHHNMSEFPPRAVNSDVYLFTSNRGVTYNVFDNVFHADTLLGMGLTRQTIFPCMFNYLFQLDEGVCVGKCKEVEARLLKALEPDSNTVTIGIQVGRP